jgi:hypothetical protein
MMAQSAKLGELDCFYAFAIRAITRSTISGWRRTLRGLSRCWTSTSACGWPRPRMRV